MNDFDRNWRICVARACLVEAETMLAEQNEKRTRLLLEEPNAPDLQVRLLLLNAGIRICANVVEERQAALSSALEA